MSFPSLTSIHWVFVFLILILHPKLISMVLILFSVENKFKYSQNFVYHIQVYRFFPQFYSLTTLTINRFGIFPICCNERRRQKKHIHSEFLRSVSISHFLTRYLGIVVVVLFHNKFLFVYPRYSLRQHLLLLSESWFSFCTICCVCSMRARSFVSIQNKIIWYKRTKMC